MLNLNESNEATTMESLCDDVLIETFSYLDLESLKNSTLVCKNWNEVIGSSSATMNKFILQVYKIDANAGSEFQRHRKYKNITVCDIKFERSVEILRSFDVSQVKNFGSYNPDEAIEEKLLMEFLSRMPQLEVQLG